LWGLQKSLVAPPRYLADNLVVCGPINFYLIPSDY
jgi:hypothetical protein